MPEQANLPTAAVADAALVVGGTRAEAFLDYEVGGKTKEGFIVRIIEARGPDYIVFRCEGESDFRFESGTGDWYKRIARQIGFYRGEAAVSLLGAYGWRFSRMLCDCTRSALDAGPASDVSVHFEPAKKFLQEWGPVRRIFGTGRGFIIYQNKKGDLAYETQEGEPAATYKAETRLIEAMAGNLPPENQERLTALLGGALASALQADTKEKGLGFFVPARQYVENVSDALARAKYLSASSFVGLIVLLLIWTAYFFQPELIRDYWVWAISGGVLGALISIAQRNHGIRLNTVVPYRYLAVQGIVRVSLGAAFGLLAALMAKANLAFGTFSADLHTLFILSVVGGVSERLVPDVLSRLAASGGEDKNVAAESQPTPAPGAKRKGLQ